MSDASETLWQFWKRQTRFDLCVDLSLIVLLFVAPGVWYIQLPVQTLAILGLVARPLRNVFEYWFAIVALLVAGIVFNWEWLDNHVYLEAYWFIALLLCCKLPHDQREKAVALNGKWLLCLCMLLATIWKVRSPDYLSGEFFEYTLLTDSRFAGVTSLLTDLSLEQLDSNHQLLDSLRSPEQIVAGGQLHESPRIPLLAWVLTWWTVIIEGIIGLLFLLPRQKGVGPVRDWTLAIFLFTTYFVAPVRGFGWMLAILGLAQTESAWMRAVFFAAFVTVQIHMLPYTEMLRYSVASGP